MAEPCRPPAIPRRWRLLTVLTLVAGLLLLSAGVAAAQAVPPKAISEQGDDIRTLYFIVFGFAAAVFLVVEVVIVWLAFRYRRRNDALPPQIRGNHRAEILWTAIPTVIVVILFAISFVVLDDIESAPGADEPVEVIDVLGQQWQWTFIYTQPLSVTITTPLSADHNDTSFQVSDGAALAGLASPRPLDRTIRIGVEHMRVESVDGNTVTVSRRESDGRAIDGTVLQDHAAGAAIDRVFNGTDQEQDDRGDLTALESASGERSVRDTPVVTVPVGKTVLFNISSRDVIHSFYTPRFLYKLDAVPGRTQALWLKVTDAGFYQGQCAEFCGRGHARMLFSVRALPQNEYDAWLQAKIDALAASASAAPPPPPSDDSAAAVPARGEAAFFANGCNACHGDQGQGGIGPTIAQTGFSVDQVRQQSRTPRGFMPPFTESAVPDDTVADIHAWLQTLPLPDTIVPGEGTP